MKAILSILLLVVSLHMVPSEAAEVAVISITDDLNSVGDSYFVSVAIPTPNFNGGYLEKAEMAIGSILKSYHFSKYDYNETHDGLYIRINKWSMGTYNNSSDVQSTFVTYNPGLYRNELFRVNLVAGVANGYEGWEYAQGDYLPVLGVSAQWKYLKTMIAPDAVAFGIEMRLN